MMLYTFYELQHAAFAPLRFAADHGQQFFRQPYNPLSHTPAGKFAAASLDMVEQLTRRYGKPKFGLDTTVIDGNTVEVTEQIVSRKPFGQLKRFKRKAHRSDPKVLVVAPMSGHFATLLRGTVEALLPDHDVYITDWRDARDIPVYEGSFDLDDYVDYLIDWFEDLGPNLHVIAVCQPSVPVYAAVALMDEEGNPSVPSTVTMMGGPVDTRANPTEVNELATKRPLAWFEENVITVVPLPNAGFMRRVYPGFLQLAGFMTMNLGDHVIRHQELFQHLIVGDGDSADKTKTFYEEYRSVADMTAEFYLQTIEVVFQNHSLPKGEWVSRGRKVDPSKITTAALMAVEGELDDISGVGQTKAALTLAKNLDEKKKSYVLAKGVGHYGIFNGRKWREVISPEVKAFIRANDKMIGAKPAVKKAAPKPTAALAGEAHALPAPKTPAKRTAARKSTAAKPATQTKAKAPAKAATKPAAKPAAPKPGAVKAKGSIKQAGTTAGAAKKPATQKAKPVVKAPADAPAPKTAAKAPAVKSAPAPKAKTPAPKAPAAAQKAAKPAATPKAPAAKPAAKPSVAKAPAPKAAPKAAAKPTPKAASKPAVQAAPKAPSASPKPTAAVNGSSAPTTAPKAAKAAPKPAAQTAAPKAAPKAAPPAAAKKPAPKAKA